MGLLDNVLSTIDAKKRSVKRGLMDMLDNPSQWAGMQANRIQEDRYGGAENAQAMKQYLSKQPYDPKALTAANDALRNAAINESLGAIFIGKGAKTWDKMKEADAMARLAKGEDAATVWKETGIAVAPWDKAPRAEISDHTAKLTPISELVKQRNADLIAQRDKIVANVKEAGRSPTDFEKAHVNQLNELIQTSAYRGTVGDALDHPELFAAHPQLKGRDFRWREMPVSDKGSWDQNSGMMLNQGLFGNDAKSIVLHEGQHASQDYSKLSPGGSPAAIAKNPQNYVHPDVIEYAKSLPAYSKNDPEEFIKSFSAMNLGDPYEAYRKLGGEAEARLAQYRMNLTPEARSALYPYDPAYFKQATGVDIDKLITRGLLDDGPAEPAMSIAWHGSPHKFDKFDMSKIGTGEGAQAYGHGLYMAESPDVAKTYGLAGSGLSEYKKVSYGGNTYESFDPMAALLYDITKKGRAPVIQNLEKQVERQMSSRPDYAKKLQEKIDFVKSVNPDKVKIEGGSLYKVDIPDEAVARFLDWDKPLSQQSTEVQAAITKAIPNYSIGNTDKRKAADAYLALAEKVGDAKASEMFKEQGVSGIRYLDGGSRSAGQGSSNYVLFDDQLPRILERNGQPTGLQPWAKGEWKGLLDEPAPKLTEFEQRHLTAQKNAALPVEQGGLGLPPNNTAMDRMKAQNYDVNFQHGSADGGINAFELAKTQKSDAGHLGQAVYGGPIGMKAYTDGGVVYPLVARSDGMQRITPKNWNVNSPYSEVADAFSKNWGNQEKAAQDYTKSKLEKGITGIIDESSGNGLEQIAIYDPTRIRSRFAAFDPMRRHEADLLGYADPYLLSAMGAGGLLGMGGYSMMNDK